MQAQEKTANIKQPWHSRADVTPNCASACARAAAGLAMGTSMHTHISASLVRLGDGGVCLERSAADDYYSHSASPHNQQAIPGRLSLLTSAPRMPVLQQLAPSTSREAWDFESTERLCPPPQLVSTICAACPGSRKQTWAQVRRWKKIYTCAMHNCYDTYSWKLFCSFFRSFLWE